MVTDLTTDAFIGSLKRFISHRGSPQKIYCDNATNFVGASNLLQDLGPIVQNSAAQEKIATSCANKGIDFSFIPPRAPHFGGLWEAAIKVAKHHLVRTTSTASLTHEELEIVVIEIEAILNSRALTPLSNNSDDLAASTPGHFLVGAPLTAPIDPHKREDQLRLTSRWRLVQQLKQEFWDRWSTEYLHTLQMRYRWKLKNPNVEPGTLVLIQEDNTPIMKLY